MLLTRIVLGDGGHHSTVNNNGCQELPLIPSVSITSTNRDAHLPLDVGRVKESDWMLERSKESSGRVYWLRLFKQGG